MPELASVLLPLASRFAQGVLLCVGEAKTGVIVR